MNIQGDLQRLSQITEISPASSAPEKASTAEPASEGQTANTDQMHLSAAAANIASQSSGAADIRSDKVAAIQTAIADGSYGVEASEVAGKLIDHMLGSGK